MGLASVESYMTFLARDEIYEKEKPYQAGFLVDDIEGAEMTNHKLDVHPVTFYDARTAEKPFTLDRNGFCYIKGETSLKAEDATSERTEPMVNHLQEIIDILKRKFPQYNEIAPMDFQVRIRVPTLTIDAKLVDSSVSGIQVSQKAMGTRCRLLNRRQWLIRTFLREEHICVWRMFFQVESRTTKTENLTCSSTYPTTMAIR